MSQLYARMITGDEFNYNEIYNKFEEENISSYSQWVYNRFSSTCNCKMTVRLNSEWIARHYLATKMILSASIMLTSLQYSIEHNLRICEPYLKYYSILTSCRALVFTLPNIEWNNDSFLKMNHSKIINTIKDCFMKLDKDYGNEIYSRINLYKEYRELFSYRFPANGLDNNFDEKFSLEETIDICKIICELAQLNSEQVHKYIQKNCLKNINEWAKLDDNYIEECFSYKLGGNGQVFGDSDDFYRIDYIKRKQPFPVSLYYTMTEGMIEDFIESWWCEHKDEENIYDPYENYRIIFPFP